MSYLEYREHYVPSGFRKILYINWPLVLLVSAVSCFGFLMLYSVAGGSFDPWASTQMRRFGMGMAVMFVVALIPIWFWRGMSIIAYLASIGLLLVVMFFGDTQMGAQRWIDLGFMFLQPSEVTKITVVLLLAAYYDWLPYNKRSNPIWVGGALLIIAIPCSLVLPQPDLGTTLLIAIGGITVMFAAGVHWAYFATATAAGVGLIAAVFKTRGTEWQFLKDYHYKRIDTFIDPSADPLGAGYHISQAKIALGSGGWTGRGFMQGTQSRLNFLPEKQTDFIFTSLAEEFGFLGGMTLISLYGLILLFCLAAAVQMKDRFSSLLTIGIAMTFFLFFAVNMAMVMGLAPVVGVPLPLVSYGGSSMLVLLGAFGLIQSAHVHRPR